MGGSFIKRSSISKLFRIDFREEVIELFSIFIVISFFILFLDEPTLGLDINAQRNLREFLKKYNKETNATICLTSHYMKDITSLCKRVICVHEGAISVSYTHLRAHETS